MGECLCDYDEGYVCSAHNDDREADTHPRVNELRQQGVRPYIEL